MGQKTEVYDREKVQKIAQKVSDALVGQDRKYIVSALGAVLLYEIVDVSKEREDAVWLADWVTKKLYTCIDASFSEKEMRREKMAFKKSKQKLKVAERTPSELLDEYEELKHELRMAEHALNMLAQKHDEMREEFFEMNGAQLREVTDRWQAANKEYQEVVVDRVDRMEGIFRAKQRPFKQHIRELSERIAVHPGRLVDEDEGFF